MEKRLFSGALFLSLLCVLNHSSFASKSNPPPTKPNMNSIAENNNGPTVQTANDGTKIINNQDGSTVQIHPDGSLMVINSDGSTIQKNADGSEVDSKI